VTPSGERSWRDNRVLMAVLLSAAVCPGAGQIRNRDLVKGLVLVVLTVVLLLGLLGRLYGEVAPLMAQPPDLDSVRPAVERAVANAFGGWGKAYGLGLTGLWVYSIIDAFYVARFRPGA
jgi:hypothetical protein